MKIFERFLKDESGATAIEYALLAGLIGVGVVAAAEGLGDAITELLERVETEVDAAVR